MNLYNLYNTLDTQLHPMIKRIGTGDASDFEEFLSASSDYPVMWYATESIRETPADQGDYLLVDINFLACDLLEQDKSNAKNIYSTLLTVMIDYFHNLRVNHTLSIGSGIDYVPFQERYNDYCAGYGTTVTFVLSKNDCSSAYGI